MRSLSSSTTALIDIETTSPVVNSLFKLFTSTKFYTAQSILHALRVQKSPAEIALMRRAADIASNGRACLVDYASM